MENTATSETRAAFAFLAPLLRSLSHASLSHIPLSSSQDHLSPSTPPPHSPPPRRHPPHITLTYAQSLDGYIGRVNALDSPGPLALSGHASLLLTHALRSVHDALLIGIATVLSDHPSLTTRYLISPTTLPSPRPIILDAFLQCPLNAPFLTPDRRPILLTLPEQETVHDNTSSFPLHQKLALERAGAVIVPVPPCPSHPRRIHLPTALSILSQPPYSISSLMVEGGARVISQFLTHPEIPVDTVIITIAPVYLGSGIKCFTPSPLSLTDGHGTAVVGDSAGPRSESTETQRVNPRIDTLQVACFGSDIVIMGTLDKKR